MFKEEDKKYQLYHGLLSMLVTYALVLAINQYFALRVHVLVGFVYAVLPSVLVLILNQYRKNTITYLILLSLLPAAGLLFWIKGTNPVSWLRSIAQWTYYYNGSDRLYNASYANFLLLGIALASSFLFFLLVKYQITKAILAMAIFILLVLLSVASIPIHKFVIGISFFYVLSVLLELTGNIYGRKTGKAEKKAGILYLVPICLLISVISVGMPSKLEPIQWRGVKAFYYNIKDRIDIMITEWEFFRGEGQDEFSLALTGYSEEGSKLGQESLTRSDKVALKLKSLKNNASVYLIGSVSDIYTGYSWEKSRKDVLEGEKEYLLDYMELVYALSRQDTETLYNNRYVDRNLFNITYKYLKTKTFFYPTKTSGYEMEGNTKVPQDNSSNILFSKALGEGTSYQVLFYEMNLKGEAFQEMLREADQFSYSMTGTMDARKIRDIKTGILGRDNADSLLYNQDSYERLAERAELIRENYLGLPELLPERVRELAVEITKDQETTYDKLKAIEEYLLNYTYDLQPGAYPEGEDFVDYFLFENKKGFCTSFASAMAILARCVEIPTRYVEGYVVDYEDEVDRYFQVRNNKAHSWAEAYVEGVGWIPFEATPPFFGERYTTWKDINEKEKLNPDDYSNFLNRDPGAEMPPKQTEGLEDKGKDKEGMSGLFIGSIILVSTLFTILVVTLIYYVVISRRYKKAFQRADYSGRMYMYFLRILSLVQKEGYRLDSQDTILILADRIKEYFIYEGITFPAVAEIFMRNRYGKEVTTQEEFEQVECFYQGLSNMQRAKTGRIKLLLEEIIYLTKEGYR